MAREATKSLENARSRSPVRSPFTPTIRIAVILLPQKSRPDGKHLGQSTYHKKSRPDGKRVGQSTSPSSTLRLYTGPARKLRKKMCYLGVGTTPLKRGVKPPQSAFSRLFRSPSGSDGFWSPSGSNEKRRRKPSGFDGQNCRASDGSLVQVVSCGWKAQPHFCTNADLWLVLIRLDIYSCQRSKRDESLVQVVSCGWKAQPRFYTNADLWLVLIRWPRQRMGYSRIPPTASWF
jgi:hypothetical protein